MFKPSTIKAYYAVVAFILASQVVYTIYQGSLLVNYGQKVAQLEQTKAELDQKRQKLTQTLASSVSLVSLSQSNSYTEFQPIATSIKVTDVQAVALR